MCRPTSFVSHSKQRAAREWEVFFFGKSSISGMVGARARVVATTLGLVAMAAIIVSRQSEGGWRGSSDKVTLAQDPYAEARGEMKARGPAINKLLEHSVELETRLANQEKAERKMADAVQAAQRKVDALKAKDAKLHMVIGWPQRGGAMPTTYPAFGGLPSQEDGAEEADGDLYAYDSSKPDAVLVVDGTTGVTSGSWWDNPMDWFKAGSASKSREVPMIRAPWDAQASYAQASWPPRWIASRSCSTSRRRRRTCRSRRPMLWTRSTPMRRTAS
jgi:hypothetical protein